MRKKGKNVQVATSQSQEALIMTPAEVSELTTSPEFVMGPPVESLLTYQEKRFLLFVERGDVASTRSLLEEYKDKTQDFSINCADPLGRSALVIAIENENYDLLSLLLDFNIQVKDALLHAINESYVEAVELLLEWEEKNHKEGEAYSWEAMDKDKATFTADITPLVLAAHKNNYEILKLLLDRGASLPMPHDVRCGCDECVVSSREDSLRHSRSRINAYRALSSPSLIALSSKDPVLTAFELSNELARLLVIESEFSEEYNRLRIQVEKFATSLLDHTRSSYELEVMLNHKAGYGDDDDDAESPGWQPGEHQSLDRLKLAIDYIQKDFVAHPNVQQLLGTIWYEGLPGFRRRSLPGQFLFLFLTACQFPLYSFIYMVSPNSEKGKFMKKPFVKFICHSASYVSFLFLLGLASQRVEYLIIEWFGPTWMQEIMAEWIRKERGSIPGPVECAIIFYVMGYIWGEIKSLWSDGLLAYIHDLWNIVDFITYVFYTAWILLRVTAWFVVQRELWAGKDPYIPREDWTPYDPMLLSEGMFGAAMIFSFLKMVHVFSVSPHLGPLQISLGRMVIDIIKFFFIYMLVLFAFGCGMNQLLWYYAELERNVCYSLEGGLPDLEKEKEACFFWRRFANLFETSQSLFWASFGLVDLQSFELTGVKSFTRFWSLLMFGSYSVINIIVLLNMLIAMMSNSYQIISEKSDTEWKFARAKLWISYFDDGATVPPPFNMFPTPKSLFRLLGCRKRSESGSVRRQVKASAEVRHMEVMKLLVRRYVTAEQMKSDEQGVTEDDVNEIKQDISAFRYELINILTKNGMDTSSANLPSEQTAAGKKGRVRERRLMKGFQIGMVEDIINEVLSTEKGTTDVFGKIARAIVKRGSSHASKDGKGKDWNALNRARSIKHGAKNPIGSKEASQKRWSQQSLRRSVLLSEREAILSFNPDTLVEYNPRLKEYSATTRVAYAKFKSNTLKPLKEKPLEEKAAETESLAPPKRQMSKSAPPSPNPTPVPPEKATGGEDKPLSLPTDSEKTKSDTAKPRITNTESKIETTKPNQEATKQHTDAQKTAQIAPQPVPKAPVVKTEPKEEPKAEPKMDSHTLTNEETKTEKRSNVNPTNTSIARPRPTPQNKGGWL